MNAKQLGTEKVRWNLAKFFYSGIDDPQLDKDVEMLVAMEKDFHAAYKGKLAETLPQAMRALLEMDMLGEKVGSYIELLKSLDVADSKVKTKKAAVEGILSNAAGEYCEFFDIELAALDTEVCEHWHKEDAFVAKHRSWIEQVRRNKPHMLSEPVESALTKRSPFGEEAWTEFFVELVADMEFTINHKKMTLEEALTTLSASPDSDMRAKIMGVINRKLGGYFAKYSAETLWIVAGGDAVEDKERKYAHPMVARNMSNCVSDEMVVALHNAVRDFASPFAKRFYRLKAKHLGLAKLQWSDRNAPMPFADSADIPFDDAMKMVIAAYQSFSPTLAEKVRRMGREKRIDAPVVKRKEDGAFCHWQVFPNGKPLSFTFLNYLGSSRDVMTLAHEVGHGVHGELAGEAQGSLMCSAPTAYAETASIFGEMTTYNFLKAKLLKSGNKELLLALIMKKLDESMNCVVRQIGFSNFERQLHGMDTTYSTWKPPKKLSVKELDELWLTTLKEMYGEEGEIFTYKNAEHLWSYIPHFHRPFYVYGYAFGELLVQSLYASAPALGDSFEPLYLDALRSGSTRNVVEFMAPFGLDPANEDFWVNGIHVGMGKMLKEAEDLSAEMGIYV